MSRKKKIRQSKHQKEPGEEADTSEEESSSQGSAKGCPHVTRSINPANLKKALKNHVKATECQGCTDQPNKPASTLTEQEAARDSSQERQATIWICLQCGYQGCGRTAPSQHAILHHQTPHSDPHDLVVNPDNWAIWCYKCDDEVGIDSVRRLTDCVDMLKKHLSQLSRKSPPSSRQVPLVHKVNIESPKVIKEPVKHVEEVPKSSPKKPINGMKPDLPVTKVKGLSNLGNTCFFNAVLQSLSQCRCFVGVLRDHCTSGHKWHIDLQPEQRIKDKDSVDVTLGSPGSLTDALVKFLEEMDQASQKKNGVVSPAQLFKRVCEKASQFRGFQQQDSHELLRCLLDAVKNEEVKRQRLSLLPALGIDKTAHKDLNEETRSALKALSAVTDFTVVERVFGGQLVSTVQCEECHVSSQVFETFMDLSLPVFEEKPTRPGLHKRNDSAEKAEGSDDGIAYRKSDSKKPSRHQEKKMKRQQKRDAKKLIKSQKSLDATISIGEDTEQVSEVREEGAEEVEEITAGDKDDQPISEAPSLDSIGAAFPDMEVYINEADVEDNDDTSSHHSHGSTKSHNESDMSSLSPSETVCASGSTTVESDLTATENIEDTAAQVLEFGNLCQQVASLDLNQAAKSKDNLVLDSSMTANTLTSPGSVEVASTDSGIVGSSTDSGIFQNCGPRSQVNYQRASRKRSQEMLATSLTPLAPPCKLASQECSVLSSLHQFTMRELLMGNNKFGCENCTRRRTERCASRGDGEKPGMVYTNASKQLLISSPPAVLTLQFKRFQQVGRNLMKVNRYVEFPILLDLAPFCSRLALALPHVHRGQQQIIYALVGVVEHSGKLTGGHYTAFVKVQPQQPSKYPFLNHKLMGEKELQFLMEEVERKHDKDFSWEMYSDLEEHSNLVFEHVQKPDVPPGKWFHISDSHVTEVSESTVLRCKAYLLFYERIV